MTRVQALVAAVVMAAAACAATAERREARDRPDLARSASEAAGAEGPRLYVTNQDGASISVIDVVSREVIAQVDLQAMDFGLHARPHDTAVEPDGSFWYVSLIGENRVLKLDRENQLVGQVEMEVPGLVVLHPTEDLLLVGRSMTAVNPPSSVALIRRSDMTLLDEIDVVYPRPHALRVRPQGDWAYSASLAENRMAVIEPVEGEVELVDVPTGAPEEVAADTMAHAHAAADTMAPAGTDTLHHAAHTPHTLVDFAIAPDGGTMVAGGELSGQLLVLDLTDPAAPRLVRTVALGGAPWHAAFTPDGRWVYVPLHLANAVAVVDASTWEVVARIEGHGLAQPHAAVAAPDGRTVFVSNNNTGGEYVPEGSEPKAGTVVVIDVATREIVEVLEVGPNATGMEIGSAPDTGGR